MLALLAGCGGDKRMSKADYEHTINQSGRKLSAVFGTVDQNTTNLHQVAVRVARARRTLIAVTNDLDAVKPPKAAERPHASLVVALRTLAADLQKLAEAADRNDAKAVTEARARLATPGRQLVAAIQQLQQAGFAINTG